MWSMRKGRAVKSKKYLFLCQQGCIAKAKKLPKLSLDSKAEVEAFEAKLAAAAAEQNKILNMLLVNSRKTLRTLLPMISSQEMMLLISRKTLRTLLSTISSKETPEQLSSLMLTCYPCRLTQVVP